MKILSIKSILFPTICFALVFTSCNSNTSSSDKSETKSDASYTATIDGKAVKLYTLTNKSGASVSITNYGGRVVSILVPDKDNRLVDVSLGYDSVKSYRKEGEPFFGALIGRYGTELEKASLL